MPEDDADGDVADLLQDPVPVAAVEEDWSALTIEAPVTEAAEAEELEAGSVVGQFVELVLVVMVMMGRLVEDVVELDAAAQKPAAVVVEALTAATEMLRVPAGVGRVRVTVTGVAAQAVQRVLVMKNPSGHPSVPVGQAQLLVVVAGLTGMEVVIV